MTMAGGDSGAVSVRSRGDKNGGVGVTGDDGSDGNSVFARHNVIAWTLAAALLVRLAVLGYGEWLDNNLPVKYTDVDYVVFTDAARFMHDGLSPYVRHTYRYTPLLAWMLQPNVTLHPAFGKVVFVAADMVIGAIVYTLIKMRLHEESSDGGSGGGGGGGGRGGDVRTGATVEDGRSRNRTVWRGVASVAVERRAVLLTCLWLFNPFSINVSTRGNAESLISVLVMGTLLCVAHSSLPMQLAGAVLYGVAVHFKIYPVVYAPALFLYIDRRKAPFGWTWRRLRRIVTPRRALFTAVSASVAIGCTLLMYHAYGYEGIYEAYLHHVWRKDTRHNFSVYFYQLYLHSGGAAQAFDVGLLAFVPQLATMFALALRYHEDIGFCTFMQTFVFVAFNKVCTVQYFMWFFPLLPLVVHSNSDAARGYGWRYWATLFAVWQIPQAAWLFTAYRLEFLGEAVFSHMFAASVAFFVANVGVALSLLKAQRSSHTKRD